MIEKISDSELKVLKILWRDGECAAKQICEELVEEEGWNVNTTYTLIKRCVKKGTVERTEPGFICRALVSQKEIQREGAEDLIDRMFGGSVDSFFAAFLDGKKLSADEIEALKRLVERLG